MKASRASGVPVVRRELIELVLRDGLESSGVRRRARILAGCRAWAGDGGFLPGSVELEVGFDRGR